MSQAGLSEGYIDGDKSWCKLQCFPYNILLTVVGGSHFGVGSTLVHVLVLLRVNGKTLSYHQEKLLILSL